jgi:hypothetical protein
VLHLQHCTVMPASSVKQKSTMKSSEGGVTHIKSTDDDQHIHGSHRDKYDGGIRDWMN